VRRRNNSTSGTSWCVARVAIGSLALAATITTSLVLPPAPRAEAATVGTFHVSPSGSDRNPGTEESPVRTVSRAVALAASGSSIVLHSGTYHESVHVFGKDLDVAAAPGSTVIFDGSRPVGGWVRSGTGWYSPGWTATFARTSGDQIDPAVPMAAYPDLAFLDGSPLHQVASLSALGPGRFFVDHAADRLWIGDDPAGRLVEASDLSWAIWFNAAHGSSLRGVTVRRYATSARDMAAVRLYADGVTMTDSTVARNAYSGVSVIGRNVRMERLTVRDNGYIGVHGHLSRRVDLLRSTIVRNNSERFDAVHSGAGVKFTTSSIIGVRNSYVADNLGVGVWTDLGASFVSVTGNLIERNSHSGVLMELSGRVVVADNVVLDSGEAGVWILETNDAEVWHNALYRNRTEISVMEGPRTDASADAVVLWDLLRVRIRNNVIGHARTGVEAAVSVDDWTERRSASSMAVTSDWNAFWLPPQTSTRLARWARWPERLAVNATLDGHRAATGQDRWSTWSAAATNPFARSMSNYDLRMPSGSRLGTPIRGRAAPALGVADGTQLPLGPRRWMTPPTDGVGVRFRS
jgi:hypothetical protein